METTQSLLAPLVVLASWTMVMWLWMYATRIPAIMAAKMKMDPHLPRGEQMNQLPSIARWKADNYNHLMEQPTVFYAVVLALALMGASSDINVALAWAYASLRIVHSVFQATVNKIEIRFLLFVLSSLPLIALCWNAAMLAL